MQCFYPVTVRGPDYSGPVPCGHCFACQSNRRKDWFFRIKYEMRSALQSFTVTLTYDDDHLPDKVLHIVGDPLKPPYSKFWYHPYDYSHVQKFFKRLRKKGYEFRYFGVAEYGSHTARPHYHIIFFFPVAYDKLAFTNDVYKEWYYGTQIVLDDTNDDCIGYTLKYCIKVYNNHDPSPKIFLSKRPYIGFGYLSGSTVTYLRSHTGDIVYSIVGRQRLPRLIRDKVYDDDMKEANKEFLEDALELQRSKLELEANERGVSYDELIKMRQDALTDSCLNQIKKKKL